MPTDRPTARAERGTAIVFAVSGAVQASWMSRLPALWTNLHLDLAQLGFALFALGTGSLISMPVTGRLCRRFGSRRVVWASTLVACAALVGLGWVSTALDAGALCWGLGICVVFPAVLSAGGRSAAGDGVAALTTVGYVAAFVAPPLIGTGGERVGLGYALLVLPVLAVAVVLLAPVVDRAPDGSAGVPAQRRVS